jgi:AAA family ATP:ADP antiporter
LKPMLIPLLDQISILKKNEILKRYFLRAKYDPLTSLYQLINKDYNEINRWTKACAIPKLLLFKNRTITNALVANLFHPDKLIREISAYVIYTISPEKYMQLSIRMKEKHKKEIDILLMFDPFNAPKTLMFAKILFLKTIPVFSRISGALLANLVDYMEEVEYKSGTVLYQDALEGKDPILIIYKGMLTLTQADGKVFSECKEKYILGDKLMFDIDKMPLTFTAAVDTIVFRIAKDRYFDIISMYYPLAKAVLPTLNKDVEMEQDYLFQHAQLN